MSAAPASRLLLASEGRPFADAAIAAVARRASAATRIEVLVIARIWGSAFGFPNPWLLPSRREWEARRATVARAIEALAALGLAARGAVVGHRDAARRILSHAEAMGADLLVMGADPHPPGPFGALFWSAEPYRVRRRARLPVLLVTPPGADLTRAAG